MRVNHSSHQNCKSKHNEMRYVNSTQENKVLKEENSLLELKKILKSQKIEKSEN